MTSTITRDELIRSLEDDTVSLIEALPTAHYDLEHIPGAINFPGALTAADAARISPDKDRTVVVYCSGPSCGRSKVTAAAFTRAGYTDVRVYSGGKADWFEAGLPLERTAVAS